MQKLTISLMLAAIIFILGFSTYAAFPEEAPTPYTCIEHGPLTEDEIIPFTIWEEEYQLCIHCVFRFMKNHSLVIKEVFKEAKKRGVLK